MSANILDAEGEFVCSNGSPCRLEGPPPYRLMALNPSALLGPFAPFDYQVAARSIGPGSGCPVVAARPFGESGTDVYPGMGCRQFDVLPGQTVHLSVLDTNDDPLFSGATLIGPDGRLVDGPQDDPFWHLAPGRHTLVVNPVSAHFLTMLHTVADSRGCQPLAADLTPVATRTPFAGADCYRLDSLPGDEIHPISLTDARAPAPPVVVVDALGQQACDNESFEYCTLAGLPPFRAIVGSGESTPYLLAFLDRDDPPTCQTVALGSRSGVLVQLSAQRPIDCLTVPSVPDGTTAVHVRRMLGSGGSVLVDVPESISCHGDGMFSAVRRYRCDESGLASDSHDVLIVGDGHDQVSYVAATSPAVSVVDEPGITRFVTTTRPRLRGTPVVGQKLRADPGAWAPGVPGIRFTYRWYVGSRTVPGAKGRTLTLRPQYAGKRVRVQVTAATETLLPGTAKSAALRVRRH